MSVIIDTPPPAPPPPPYTTLGPTENPSRSHDYIAIGFFGTLFLLIIITYASCRCKDSQSPTQVAAATYDDRHADRSIRFSRGLNDDVIVTLPTFVYSEGTTPHKCDNDTRATNSNCSICLEDYKPADIIRLFPECGHLFHVRCIDVWLKVHPTCPMCRKFAGVN